jgi:hypothetical protein
MSTPSIQSTTVEQPGSQRASAEKIQKPGAEEAKAQFNASILKASMEVSISSKNEPMQLLLKTVVTKLNEVLKDQLGDNAIQNAASQDNTPEGTAGRIVSLSTGFFEAFKAQHPGEGQAELVDRFLETIKKGVDQGFKEARDILQGLDVLKGDIASNIDKTYELVQKKLEDFRSSVLGQQTPAAQTSGTEKQGSSIQAT